MLHGLFSTIVAAVVGYLPGVLSHGPPYSCEADQRLESKGNSCQVMAQFLFCVR